MARLAPQSLVLPAYQWGTPLDEQEGEKVMRELMSVSDNLPEGEVVGAILQFPAADGYAVYRVTKASPLTVEHVDYMDAWSVDPILIRGLNKQDVLDHLARRKKMNALFGRS